MSRSSNKTVFILTIQYHSGVKVIGVGWGGGGHMSELLEGSGRMLPPRRFSKMGSPAFLELFLDIFN